MISKRCWYVWYVQTCYGGFQPPATSDLLRGHFFAHGPISEAYICHYNGSFINNVLMIRSKPVHLRALPYKKKPAFCELCAFLPAQVQDRAVAHFH